MAKEPEKPEFNYIMFPLCGLQEIIKDRRAGLNLVVGYGIVHYALKLHTDNDRIARQIIYDYYKNQRIMSDSLIEQLDHFYETDLAYDEQYNGFPGGSTKFEPDELPQMVELLEKNNDFKAEAEIHSKIQQAEYLLNLSHNVPTEEQLNRYNKLKEIQSFQDVTFGEGSTFVSCKPEMILNFRNGDDPIEWFLMFAAIKSFIGQRKFTSTFKSGIRRRMIGVNKNVAIANALKDDKIADVYERFDPSKHRSRFDNHLAKLLQKNFLKSKIGAKEGIYFSTTLDYDQLVEAIHEHKGNLDTTKKEREAREKLRKLRNGEK